MYDDPKGGSYEPVIAYPADESYPQPQENHEPYGAQAYPHVQPESAQAQSAEAYSAAPSYPFSVNRVDEDEQTDYR